MAASALPELQEISVPQEVMPPHKQLYQKRQRLTRGSSHRAPEAPGSGLLTGSLGGGLAGMLTSTAGTTLSHIGSSASAPRIVIPLPAALATATHFSTGEVIPTPVGGASGSPAKPESALPSMLVDSEWFFIQSYPEELRQYLTTSFSFDLKPTSPVQIVELTWKMLVDAYNYASKINMDIKIADGLKTIFSKLVKVKDGKYEHPYTENEETRALYLILAYVFSTQLWLAGYNLPLRNYPEVTYPGVIMASFVSRMKTYYLDLSKELGLSPTQYKQDGGRLSSSDTSALLRHGQLASVKNPLASIEAKPAAILNIPRLALQLRRAADFATNRTTNTTNCDELSYESLKDAALNMPGLDDVLASKILALKDPDSKDPLSGKITDARCAYFLGIIKKTITPAAVLAV